MEVVIIFLILTVGLAFIGVVGDFFINLAGEGQKFIDLRWFIIGFLIYSFTAFGWFFIMKHVKLSTLGVYYAIFTMFFLTLISVFYFHENITIYEIVGIILGIFAIVLLGKFA